MLYIGTFVQVNLWVLNLLLGLWVFAFILVYPLMRLIEMCD